MMKRGKDISNRKKGLKKRWGQAWANAEIDLWRPEEG